MSQYWCLSLFYCSRPNDPSPPISPLVGIASVKRPIPWLFMKRQRRTACVTFQSHFLMIFLTDSVLLNIRGTISDHEVILLAACMYSKFLSGLGFILGSKYSSCGPTFERFYVPSLLGPYRANRTRLAHRMLSSSPTAEN